jgi:hypothetical protein
VIFLFMTSSLSERSWLEEVCSCAGHEEQLEILFLRDTFIYIDASLIIDFYCIYPCGMGTLFMYMLAKKNAALERCTAQMWSGSKPGRVINPQAWKIYSIRTCTGYLYSHLPH